MAFKMKLIHLDNLGFLGQIKELQLWDLFKIIRLRWSQKRLPTVSISIYVRLRVTFVVFIVIWLIKLA